MPEATWSTRDSAKAEFLGRPNLRLTPEAIHKRTKKRPKLRLRPVPFVREKKEAREFASLSSQQAEI